MSDDPIHDLQPLPDPPAADDPAEPAGDDGGDTPPETFFATVEEWYAEWFRYVATRHVGRQATWRWSAEWWRSAEAITRLTWLWRAWEHLRLDPATGIAVWWRDYADPTMDRLCDPDGPFARCQDGNKHNGDPNADWVLGPLPHTPAPPGFFEPGD